MAKKSSIRLLPKELRSEVDKLLADGRFTLDQVVAHVRALGADVSRSALGRYSQDFEALASDMRLAREMATAVGRELEALPEGDVGRLGIESLNTLLLKCRMALTEKDVNPKTIGMLAGAARDLQQALRSNVDTELKIRERVVKQAAKAAESVAIERGLSKETVDALRASVLGVAK